MAVTVTKVDTITPDDNLGRYLPFDVGVWTDYVITNRYERDLHVYQMGMTSPGGFAGNSVAFVQLAAPTLLLMADWTCCKIGAKPQIPSSLLLDPGWVLLDIILEPEMVEIMNDGVTLLYRLSGTYIYGHANPATAVVIHPRPGWSDGIAAFERTVDGIQVTPRILD